MGPWTAPGAFYSLAIELRRQLVELFVLPELIPADDDWFIQMFALHLPELDPRVVQRSLQEQHGIEVVAHRWNQLPLLRVSVQAYFDKDDCSTLVNALTQIVR
jgi:selenocysteine lyase/cysteine desulfurase